ncbi:MAG: Gfo/Idh/MocA family oxidoreductase [Rhodospirillales bacterium]
MTERRIGIILHGATGRMGTTQHLRNLLDIKREGGLPLANGDRLIPDVQLAGRDAGKLAALAAASGGVRWTADLDAALGDPANDIFFDCAITGYRAPFARKAIAAGKHVYLEKPIAPSLDEAMDLVRLANAAGVKHGVIQDKVHLPGLMKLRMLRDAGFFGRILSVQVEFGWWVFDGLFQPSQRSSWNYRKNRGGGLVLDMYAHFRYILDRVVAPVTRVVCRTAIQTPQRVDEHGIAYDVDTDDAAYALMELQGGIIATVTSSWATRLRRDDMLQLKIDGTHGSAVAGLHDCRTQALVNTPKPPWNADSKQPMNFYTQWQDVPDNILYRPSFRACWEDFLRHVAEDAPFVPTLLEGAKAVQLAELAYQSNSEGRWIDIPSL